MNQSSAMCRGSMVLGTGCGRCSRCIEEMPKAIATLRADLERISRQFRTVVQFIPPKTAHTNELMTESRAALYDALRAQLYDENGKLR